MKSFYNKRYLSAATALLSAFVLSVACTSVDDTLGAGLIPGGGEKLSIHIDTLGLGEGRSRPIRIPSGCGPRPNTCAVP